MVHLPLSGFARWLGAHLLPGRCLVCDLPADGPPDLCAACLLDLPWNRRACVTCALPMPAGADGCVACLGRTSPLLSAHAAFQYAEPVAGLLRRFKFRQDLAAGSSLAALMVRSPPPWLQGSVLAPLSLHRARLRQRGYDQALELARSLSSSCGVPLWVGLVRTRCTQAQSALDADRRRRNVHGAFAVVRPPPPRVVLVDDVMTTGATLEAAALALRRERMTEVRAWVCARVP